MRKTVGLGRLIDNKYQIIELIGRGGMSNVWLARDERLGKLWAVKEIKPNVDGSRGAAMRQAIIDEANFMKRLDHPAIPRVVDIIDTGLAVFVVMDYVEGKELSHVMKAQGRPFDQEEVIAWGIQLCDVLGYLHRQNPSIVYRDMKPSNVILREDGTVKLIDFGVCMECMPGTNNDGRVVGTLGYAAPEQLPRRSAHAQDGRLDSQVVIDGRTDVYALGVTLYVLVTGHTPKRARTKDGREKVVFDKKPIRAWNPRLSEGLERIILCATQTDSSKRYQSMDAMRYDLEHYRELTQEWRDAQRRKIVVFRRWMLSSVGAFLLGVACLAARWSLRATSYESKMHEASGASRVATEGGPSDAERIYTEAIELSPNSIEPYQALLEVYEYDYCFTADEDDRWRKVFGHARGLQDDPRYAQLCFDVGAGYFSYFGIDDFGGSVGNAAVASAESAAPWFRRVLDACGNEGDRNGQTIDDANVRAAHVYCIISEFYEKVTRAGKEGKDASGAYAEFWEALATTIDEENRAADEEKCAEGVRVRLCQIATEALCSSTYLTGFCRAGVTKEQALDLLQDIRTAMRALEGFDHAEEYTEVYGPVFKEVKSALGLVERNIQNVYANPVRLDERGPSSKHARLVRQGTVPAFR